VERGICPIVTLYSLAAAFQRLTLCEPAANFVFKQKQLVVMATNRFYLKTKLTTGVSGEKFT